MMETKNPSVKRTTVLIAVLFLLATVTSSIGFSLVGSVVNDANFISGLHAKKGQLALGIFFHLVNDAAVVFIGVLMFGIIRPYSRSIAIGYAGSRFLEAGILMVGKMGLLLLPALSHKFSSNPSLHADNYQLLGNIGKEWQEWSFEMAMLSVGMGGLFLCYLLFKTKLVPRTLAVLGIIGYLVLAVRSLLRIWGVPQGFELFVPVGLFELIFPIWLLIKGFNIPAKTGELTQRATQ